MTVGIKCPNCGCQDWRDENGQPWEIIKTQPISGAVRRRRRCRNCGKIIVTREKIEQKESGNNES